jgi:ubiquinone/menaquinone biosynthesis methyltransferase
MNDVMSLGLHRFWKAYFVEKLPWDDLKSEPVILDMACGTGDISQLIYQRAQERHIEPTLYLMDPSEDMMTHGQNKWPYGDTAHWITAFSEEIPLPSLSVDLYTVAFGLRNFTDRAKALSEAYRVLRPGGHFSCLEFSQPESPLWDCGYKAYLKILPLMGQVVGKNASPYVYLKDSILKFPGPKEICMELTLSGFREVESYPLSKGIVSVYTGRKI